MMDKQVNEASHDDSVYMGITEAEALTGIPNKLTRERYILNHPQFIHFKRWEGNTESGLLK